MNLKTPIARYLIGFNACMLAYVVALAGSIIYINSHKPEGSWLYLIAILPSLPIGGGIYMVLRYLHEADEYIRAYMTRRFIITTGMTLFACTFWGFAESFAQAPHLPLYLVYPLFWVIFAIVSLLMKCFSKTENEKQFT